VDRSTLVATMSARLPAILADIEALVRCESPSSVLNAVSRSADLVAAVGRQHLGTAPELIVLDGCPHLRWRSGSQPRGRVLVLAHHDTVWPLGSLETHPFSRAASPDQLPFVEPVIGRS
jgi:glutamate carboxypeptidase